MVKSKYLRWAGYAFCAAGGSMLLQQPVLAVFLTLAGAILVLADIKETAN